MWATVVACLILRVRVNADFTLVPRAVVHLIHELSRCEQGDNPGHYTAREGAVHIDQRCVRGSSDI